MNIVVKIFKFFINNCCHFPKVIIVKLVFNLLVILTPERVNITPVSINIDLVITDFDHKFLSHEINNLLQNCDSYISVLILLFDFNLHIFIEHLKNIYN